MQNKGNMLFWNIWHAKEILGELFLMMMIKPIFKEICDGYI